MIERIKEDCESMFQGGGPRTYIVTFASDRFVLRPIADGRRAALMLASVDQKVFARCKVRNERRYEWKEIK